MPRYGTNNKWVDRSHPQTLYLATVLLYINAAFWLLQMLVLQAYFLGAMAVVAVFAGLGLANEKKLGYWAAIAVASLNLLIWLVLLWYGGYASISIVINVMFAIVLAALLVHPMTRNYRRIWFRSMSGR